MKITMSQGDWQRLADRLMKSERELKAKLAEAEATIKRMGLWKAGSVDNEEMLRELEALREVERAAREAIKNFGHLAWELNDALTALDALRKDSDARP